MSRPADAAPAPSEPAQLPGAGAMSRLLPLDRFQGSLGARVYQSLKQAILSLAYRPGEIIRKAEICDTLGVSRSPVADAVARLAVEGLVRVVPQAGTYVARFSMAEIREGAFMREAIELQAVERVARIATAEDIQRLRRSLRVQEALVADRDYAGFYAEDARFHEAILTMTGFARLAQVSETAWLHVNRARQLILPVPGRVAATLDEHRAIVEAIEAHDPAAARLAVRAHLSQLIRYLEPLEREHPELFDPS
jgi:DNA-binding GntR family transcriptional regulator